MEAGESTVERIGYGSPDAIAASTVRTLLDVMEEKRHLEPHRAKRGKAKVYCPIACQRDVQVPCGRLPRSCLTDPNALLLRRLEDEQVTPADMERLRQQLTTRREKQ